MNAIGNLPVSSTASERAANAALSSPLDDTAETAPEIPGDDITASSADELRLNQMRTNFNLAQKERAELLREANVLRDMETEQMKLDDENLKKWIALI